MKGAILARSYVYSSEGNDATVRQPFLHVFAILARQCTITIYGAILAHLVSLARPSLKERGSGQTAIVELYR